MLGIYMPLQALLYLKASFLFFPSFALKPVGSWFLWSQNQEAFWSCWLHPTTKGFDGLSEFLSRNHLYRFHHWMWNQVLKWSPIFFLLLDPHQKKPCLRQVFVPEASVWRYKFNMLAMYPHLTKVTLISLSRLLFSIVLSKLLPCLLADSSSHLDR